MPTDGKMQTQIRSRKYFCESIATSNFEIMKIELTLRIVLAQTTPYSTNDIEKHAQ